MPNFFRKSIKRQFLYILFFVLLATLLGMTTFFYIHDSTNKEYERARDILVEKRGVIQSIKDNVSEMVFHMRGYALYISEEERTTAEDAHASLEENLEQLKATDLSSQEQAYVERLQSFENLYWDAYYPQLQEAISSDNVQDLTDEVADERISDINTILRVTERLRQLNEAEVTQLHDRFMDDNNQESYMLFLFVLFLFAVLLFFNRQFTRNIGKPLYELSNAAYDVAQGKNVTVAPLKRKDEIGVLSDAFREMTKRIQNREQNLSEQNAQLKEQQQQLEGFVYDLRNLNWALNESAMVIVLDNKGVISQVNANFSSISQCPEKELIGRNLLSITSHEEITTDIRQVFPDLFKGQAWSGTLEHQKKDGTSFWVHATIVPYTNEDQMIEQLIVIEQDITRIMESEKKLRESLRETEETKQGIERMNLMNNTLSVTMEKQALLDTIISELAAIYRYDYGLVFMTETPEWAAIGLNRHFEEPVAEHFQHVVNRLKDTPESFVLERIAAHTEQGYHGNGISEDLHIPVHNSAGDLVAIFICTRFQMPFRDSEKRELNWILKRLSLFLDKIESYELTEYNRQLNQDIIDNVNEGIQFVSTNGELLQYNANWQVYLQLASVAAHRNACNSYEVWMDYTKTYIDNQEAYEQYIKQAIFEEKQPEGGLRLRVSGMENKVLLLYHVAIKRHGEKIGTLFVYRDITAEYEVDQMKSNLVSTVSHELRTPLASVLGYTELMINRELKPERQARYLTTIHQEATRLTNLINDFLDLQRMEAGKQEYVKEKQAFTPIVEQVVENFQTTSPHHNLVIQKNSNNDYVAADRDKMIQVVTNLLSNAIKFSPDGGDVVVSIQQQEHQLFVHVSDEGIGIPDQELSRLFQKFNRLDNSSARKIGGTGLGLAICKEIIEAHNGKIMVRSAEGEGSVFSLVLPLVETDDHTVTQKEENGRQIVLLEDDRSLAMLLEDELKDAGFTVNRFVSGETLINQLHNIKPAAFVIDLMLGEGVDGWDVIHHIKQQPFLQDVPIFISSAIQEMEKAKEYEINHYLIKPYPPNKLSTIILQSILQHGNKGFIAYKKEEEQ
ncbi:ATP-binding protein [Terribacillus halophilus]|uniref:ATP-binding protein n=1 Tax=Terribacillus halophilus TaxID=361279 RepID=UPI00098430F1|nr:ATP-binding protein [Terribacillus halophilus]